LSGEITQAKRTSTLAKFKEGKINVLVATDVAGRGIHVDGVSHVVNYNLPEDPEDYVHRIGRTGRAGASGVSISFASEDDAFLLPDIEQLLGEPLKCISPPPELMV
jgi:ATP-dependent RNA helicase RhlB